MRSRCEPAPEMSVEDLVRAIAAVIEALEGDAARAAGDDAGAVV